MTYVLIGISLPSLDRARPLVRRRLQAQVDADRRLLRGGQRPEAAELRRVVDWAYHMILPWFALAIVQAGIYVRFVRAEVMETMTQDYVRTARAKGAPSGRS